MSGELRTDTTGAYRAYSSEFVGRVDELALAGQARQAAAGGRGSLLLVSGGAGIGKTRLCEEVAAQAHADGVPVAWGRCWTEGGAPPLWPWQAVLRDLCGSQTASVLDGDAGLDAADPERFARFSGVLDALQDRCRDAPVVVVLDDIHAADPGALLLARFVARSLHGLPLLMLVTRLADEPDEATVPARLINDLAREARRIVLRGFDRDTTATFLQALGVASPPAELVDQLQRLTGGNPLYLQEAASSAPLTGAGRALPDGIAHAIDNRLARLAPETIAVLRLAAVLGTESSVAEVAALADCGPDVVVAAAERAVQHGIVSLDARGTIAFDQELVRDRCMHSLTSIERLDAHARAASIDAGRATNPEVVVRRARHALAAALRAPEDARLAVEAARLAAREMVKGFSYEEGSSLLDQAIGVAEQMLPGEPRAPLLVERAEAVLACGRLRHARNLFGDAAAAAEAEADTRSLALAALGLGGVWVNEHRSPDERARMLGLQRRVLAELPAEEQVLRCRLQVRLAAEGVYMGQPIQHVREALDRTRELGDGLALAEALSLYHHALLGPDFAAVRLALATELIEVASAVGAGQLALVGLCWRAVDLFLTGDARATQALEDVRVRADALQNQSVLYIVSVLDVMVAVRDGRFEEAERAAARAEARGLEVGDPDAVTYHWAQVIGMRWMQGRVAEVLPLLEHLATLPTLPLADASQSATLAGCAAVAGDLGRARAELDRVAVDGLAALARSSTWLATMFSVVEAVQRLDDAALATEAGDLLRPFAALPVMPSLGVVCFGSVERLLGLTAATSGQLDEAAIHLGRAVDANRRLGNRPLTAITTAELADVLLRRSATNDIERAKSLLDAAIDEGRAIGLTARTPAWDELRAALNERVQPPLDHVSGPTEGVFRLAGSHWVVRLGGPEVVVPAGVGMDYLARLLVQPGIPFTATSLAASGEALMIDDDQPLIDERARAAYRQRVVEISSELEEAEDFADLERATRLRIELDAIVDEVERATALGGRTRTFAGPSERARTSVRKAIKRAIDRIARDDPAIGDLLRASITTGSTCCYSPTPGCPARWRTEDEPVPLM